MAWMMGIALAAAASACVTAWKLWRLKREVYEFADRLEESLDRAVADGLPEREGGAGLPDRQERKGEERNAQEKKRLQKPKKSDREFWETEDSLLGKVNEKLERVCHIQEQKSREYLEAKRQIQELIADISHQTRTPVTNQKIYLEILRQEPLDTGAREIVDKLEHQTDKLDFLFRSMVKMSRLETGIIQIQKEEGNIMDAVRRAVSAVIPAAVKKEISIYADTEEDIILSYDEKWTEEAVYNLLDNAVKYTPEHGSIHIYAKSGEIFAQLHVKDSGKGIRKERQAEIFQRFYREPEVHGEEGIGIGLYLTRQIMEMQGGYVEVRSEEGEGADFCLYLPGR